MEVSVIIPTHNRANYLSKAIQSVLEQSFTAAEIIVVDDGSTDSTTDLVRQQFPQVKLIKQDSLGVSAARNAGIKQVSGDWIAFLDSDDTWLGRKLEQQLKAVRENPELKAIHTDEIWVRNGVRVNAMQKHRKPSGWIYPECLPLCCVSPSSVLLHKEVFDHCGTFDEKLVACEDYDLWLRIFSRYPVHLCAEPLLVKQGGHADQLSKRHWGMDRFRVYALDKILQSAWLSNDYAELTIATLKQKCTVLVNGGLKRGNQELVDHFIGIAEKY